VKGENPERIKVSSSGFGDVASNNAKLDLRGIYSGLDGAGENTDDDNTFSSVLEMSV